MSSEVSTQLFDSVFYKNSFIGSTSTKGLYGIYINKSNRPIVKGELVQLNNSDNSVILTKKDTNAPYNIRQSFGVVLEDSIPINGVGKVIFSGNAQVLLQDGNTVYFYNMVGRSAVEGRIMAYTENSTMYKNIDFVGIPFQSLQATTDTLIWIYIPPKT